MGSDRVVVVGPLLDEDLDFLETVEDFAIEQLVPQLAVEAFAIAVLPGAAGLDIESLAPTPASSAQPCRSSPARYRIG